MKNSSKNLIKKDYFFFKTLYGENPSGLLNIFTLPRFKTRSFKVNEIDSVESLKDYCNVYYEVCPQKKEYYK